MAALLVGCLGIGSIFFDPIEVIAGAREIRVVVRVADGDMRRVSQKVQELDGRVERRLVRSRSLVVSIRADAVDDLWASRSVPAIADDGVDLLVSRG